LGGLGEWGFPIKICGGFVFGVVGYVTCAGIWRIDGVRKMLMEFYFQEIRRFGFLERFLLTIRDLSGMIWKFDGFQENCFYPNGFESLKLIGENLECSIESRQNRKVRSTRTSQQIDEENPQEKLIKPVRTAN
jgi:hypothetical protein